MRPVSYTHLDVYKRQVMRRALLQQIVPFDTQLTLLHGAFNIAVALPLYLILDRMKLSDEA